MTMTDLLTNAGYRATMKDGVLTVHRVPIFVECTRDGHEFSAKWIRDAVANAAQLARENYFPPLHIRHHDGDAAADANVRASGFFRITGAEPIAFKGETKLAVFADLVVTDPITQDEILRKRLPYRSVEIYSLKKKPYIDSLALLDHEAPFLQLPMLMVSGVSSNDRAGATQTAPWAMHATPDTSKGACVASFRRGDRAALLFREGLMDDDKKPTPAPADDNGQKPKPFGEGGEGGESTETESTDSNVAAVIDAIKSGAISIADYVEIKAAMAEKEAAASPAPAPDDSEKNQTIKDKTKANAPSPADKGTKMKNEPDKTNKTEQVDGTTTTDGKPEVKMADKPDVGANDNEDIVVQMAALRGRVDAGDAEIASMKAEKARDSEVAVAMKRLEGRPLGADLETKLRSFHSEFGPKAFKAYVDEIAKFTPPNPAKLGNGAADGRFTGTAGVPEVAMKFSDKGPEAVAKATQFCAQWAELDSHRATSLTQERYVELRMTQALVRN